MARLLLVALVSLWANIANPVFVRVDTRGLPEEAAMTLTQDASGFIWVGTQGGLARFDGYGFRNFLPDPSDPNALPDGYVRTLLPDGNGLWIGSSNNGLVHYDPVTGRFRTWNPDPAGRRGPRSGEVDALLRTAPDALWIGGDSGLDRFEPSTGRFSPQALGTGEAPTVWCLLQDRSGALWAGTQNGLYVRAAHARRFSAVEPRGAPVYRLYEDSRGALWAGSVNALWRWDAARRKVTALIAVASDPRTLAPGQQWSIIEPRPGVLWAGTDNAISIVDLRSGAVRRIDADADNPSGLSGGRVLDLFRDRSGLIWIANHIGGILIYNPRSRGLLNLSSSRPEIGPEPNGGALSVAAAPNGDLWAGGLDGTLVEIDPRRGRRRTYRLSNRAAIQELAYGRGGVLLLGTTAGLCELPPGAAAIVCPAGPAVIGKMSVYSILDDGRRLWVGGSNGLFAIPYGGGRIVHYTHGTGPRSLPNDQIRALYRDREHRLWIGSENGLDVLEPDGTLRRYAFDPRDPNSLGTGGTTTIVQERFGRIWAGANGGPLNVITVLKNGSLRIRHLGLQDGMPHENVDGLAEGAHGRMWVATDKGIAQIDETTLHIRALGLADGVSEAGFWAGAVAQQRDGTIFFGGLDGTTVVEPGAASPWNYAPPIVVTDLENGRHPVSAGIVNVDRSTVRLAPGSRNLTIEFAALDYSAPQSLRYLYRLDGYDRDWIQGDAAHRSATYTHLPPGNYTLAVRAANRLGAWTGMPLRVAIDAEPTWTESWWFRALAALAALLAIYALYRRRTAVLYRRQRELEETVERRTIELSEANAKLHELSVNDPLTGLRNRRYVGEHLETETAITLRRYDAWLRERGPHPPYDADILFFLIDLDNFKSINDRYGHVAGDALLVELSNALQDVFRGSDFVARWGGDEFLAVARGSCRGDAPDIAERLRARIETETYAIGGGTEVSETVSIGFAAFPFVPQAPHAFTWSQVLAFADQGLYLAKNGGRNTWCGVGSTEKTQLSILPGGLNASLEDAVRSGVLEVYSPEFGLGERSRRI